MSVLHRFITSTRRQIQIGCCILLQLTTSAHAVIQQRSSVYPPSRNDILASSTLFIRSAGGNHCSGTVIGTRALVTAANCVGNAVNIIAQVGEESYNLQCRRVSSVAETFVDLALCASDAPFRQFRPARIDAASSFSLGERLLIAGYGCSSPAAFSLGVLGRFAQGQAQLSRLDVGTGGEPLASLTGDAACFGDAGGGVYRSRGELEPILVGVMSRGDMSVSTQFVPLASAVSVDRMRRWMLSANVGICGLSSDNSACSTSSEQQTANAASTDLKLVMRIPGKTAPLASSELEGMLVRSINDEETVSDAFLRVCGRSLDSLLGADRERARWANPPGSKSLGVLQIPRCIANTQQGVAVLSEVKTVQKDETIWSIYKTKREALPPNLAPAAGPNDFANYVKEFKLVNKIASASLTPNQVVTVPPIVAAATKAPEPAGVAATAAPLGNAILSLASDSDSGCIGPAGGSAYPYNLPLLLDVIAMNRRMPDSIPVQNAMVTIADSGVLGGGYGIFTNQVLSKRDPPNFEKFLTSVQPQVLNERARSHGTMVASVAMGGPTFARLISLDSKPQIQLAINRIYYTPAAQSEGIPVEGAIQLEAFYELIRQADSKDAGIINLSLRSTVKIPAIEANLRSNDSRLLFIAAAGNQARELTGDVHDDTETMYPALYGGDSEPRVITVMAIDGNGRRSPFSNWGASYVDIAAPGCKVPALVWDASVGRFTEVAESGTSLSAPLVSFTAALIRSESGGEFLPQDIKRRILVSADLAPESLVGQSADARRLNIPKAIALKTDVVEVGGKLLFGNVRLLSNGKPLRETDDFSLECEAKKDFRLRRERVLKIARWIPAQDGSARWKVYGRAEKPRQLFVSDVCKLPSGLTLDVEKSSRRGFEALDWKDVTDVVMRHTSY